GHADTAFAWLYPYDKTVFPRGLLSPTLQFGGAASDAEYVHIVSTGLDYTGYLKGGAANAVQAAMSQKAWDAVTHAVGAVTLKVAVSKIAGSNVTGPISETWTVAQGSLRGTIYYETYNSTLVAGSAVLAAASGIGIMKIQPGASQPTILKQGCGNVCHTASADGSTLVASTGTFMTAQSVSWDLKNNAAMLSAVQNNNVFTYGGLYPNGKFLMSATNFRVSTNTASKLYDTTTAANIPAPGWDGVITMGGTTAFSPDGKQIAFVHEDKDQGHTIAKMDFNVATKTFSGLVDLATDPNGYLAWPAFTPDGKTIIYHSGSSSAFETDQGATGDIFAVDVATKTVHRLDALDGYTGTGNYLPANDPKLTFSPTVLPEAVGGYFWTVFTSHRSYGSLSPSKANGDEDGKLWVSAINIDGTAGTDISHPAFYLDGQEATADNLRGFWVLPPCQQNGTSCGSGDQCCTGFCRGSGNDQVCVMPPKGCSNQYEKCAVSSDCCDSSEQCIGGFCSQPPPQ
ncbi:MAG: TolB family protein, partial [Polyangiaceae bacterium]